MTSDLIKHDKNWFANRNAHLLQYAKDNPAESLRQIGIKYGITKSRVQQILKQFNIKRNRSNTHENIL